jgi:hypothetical protein
VRRGSKDCSATKSRPRLRGNAPATTTAFAQDEPPVRRQAARLLHGRNSHHFSVARLPRATGVGQSQPRHRDVPARPLSARRRSRRPSGSCRDVVLDPRAVTVDVTFDRVRDASSETIDELRRLADRLQRAALAPAGDVRDRLAGDIQADPAEHNQCRRFMPSMKRFGLSPLSAICDLRVTPLCSCHRRHWVFVGMPPSSRKRRPGGPSWRIVGGRAAGGPPSLSAASRTVVG